MSKLKINKKYLAWILTGAITLTGVGFILKSCGNEETSDNTISTSIENQIGHTNINPWFNMSVDSDDFVVLDMGDHDTVRTHFEDKKATFCNENDITLGMIISSDSTTEAQIYDDVEYAKNLIKQYDFDFPVYLDINRIIENPNLNNEMKTKLITDFLNKCSKNNMYVALYGTDTNLCRVQEYCGITGYDAFLVMDSPEIKYSGQYSVYQDQEGNVKSTSDVSKTVAKKSLNQSNRFVNDASHQVKYGENITDIALRTGMSIKDLLEFNNLSEKDVVPGVVIRIPSETAAEVQENVTTTFTELTDPIMGCDLSYAQGLDASWDQISDNFEFVILRSTQGLIIDRAFESNYQNASSYNIPVGVYCFNDYSSKNCENIDEFIDKQNNQADLTLQLLEGKNIEYPVYLDIEGSDINTTLDKDAINAMLDIWYEKMASHGYTPGLYCNQSGYEYIQSQVDYDISERMEVWIAGGDQFTSETEDIPLSEVIPSERVKTRFPEAAIIQSTDSAINAGAENSNGHLDVNFSYKDYTEFEVTGKMDETFSEKDFQRDDMTIIGAGLGAGCVVALGLGIIGILKEKSKSKGKYVKNK